MVNRKWLTVNFGWLLAVLLGMAACRPAPSFSPRNVVESSLPIELKWQAQVDEQVDRQPAISEEIIVVATDTALYGLEKENGARQWRHEFNNHQPSPVKMAADDEIVVYGDRDGLLTALRLSSGEVLWRHIPCNRGSTLNGSNSIIVADGVVYAAFQPTVIEARKIESGDLIWEICNSASEIPSRGVQLLLENEDLYVNTYEIHVLNVENGEIEYASEVNIGGIAQLKNGRFYGNSWVRDAETLRLINELKSPTYKPLYGACTTYRPPYTFLDDQFFGIGYCGGLMALDQETNDIQWRYNVDVDGKSPIAIYNDNLYVLFKNGEIHAVEPELGNSLGILKTDALVESLSDPSGGIVANDDILIITFGDNNIWAFE